MLYFALVTLDVSLYTTLFFVIILRLLMPANCNAYSGSLQHFVLIVSILMSITVVLMLQRSLNCTVCKFYSRLKFLGLDCSHETFVVVVVVKIFKFLY